MDLKKAPSFPLAGGGEWKKNGWKIIEKLIKTREYPRYVIKVT